MDLVNACLSTLAAGRTRNFQYLGRLRLCTPLRHIGIAYAIKIGPNRHQPRFWLPSSQDEGLEVGGARSDCIVSCKSSQNQCK